MAERVKLTAKSPEYSPWFGMVRRCTVPTQTGFAKYGGKGIQVWQEWQGDGGFENFVAHIGPRPTLGHQIDRIDGKGDYAPGNVRWATTREQARNRSSNQFLTHNGETLCHSDWAARLGITRQSMLKRLRSMPVEDALSRPRRSYLDAGRSALASQENDRG